MMRQNQTIEGWRNEIRNALEGILFITDSESPLTLLESGPLPDLNGLQRFVTEQTGTSLPDQELLSASDFLNEIHQSTDPTDEILQRNTMRFDQLFALLESAGMPVRVVRVRQPQNLIFIAVLDETMSAVIRTEAVET